jgi:hypothetical protein
MDFRAARTEHTAAVPLGGDFAVGMVLRGETGSDREFAIDAVDRRAIHTDAVLRNPEDGLVARRARTRGQRKTGTPADAADGAGSNLSEATAVGSRVRAQDLSVSAAQSQDRSTRPRLGQRYHLHSPAAGLCLSGGDHVGFVGSDPEQRQAKGNGSKRVSVRNPMEVADDLGHRFWRLLPYGELRLFYGKDQCPLVRSRKSKRRVGRSGEELPER